MLLNTAIDEWNQSPDDLMLWMQRQESITMTEFCIALGIQMKNINFQNTMKRIKKMRETIGKFSIDHGYLGGAFLIAEKMPVEFIAPVDGKVFGSRVPIGALMTAYISSLMQETIPGRILLDKMEEN